MYICIGLALITKAEFDAALADFNARLTTFEAGINSKIDSQVSSYLDRNGIWNGKDQVLYMNFLKRFNDTVSYYPTSTKGQAWWCSATSWVNYDNTTMRSRGWGTHTDWTDHSSSNLVYPTSNNWVQAIPPIKIVDNVSKSGLAVVYLQSGYQDLTVTGNGSYVNWGTTQVLGLLQNVPLTTNSFDGGNSIIADKLSNMRESLSTLSMFLSCQTHSGVSSDATGLQHIADGLATVTVFVQKDKPLYSMFWWYLNCNGGKITKCDFRSPTASQLGVASSTFDDIDVAMKKGNLPNTWLIQRVVVY